MKDLKGIGILAALAAMSMGDTYAESPTPNNEVLKRPEPKNVIPKGCNVYYFTKTGLCFTDSVPNYQKENIVYSCIASSYKSAEKKFNKQQL